RLSLSHTHTHTHIHTHTHTQGEKEHALFPRDLTEFVDGLTPGVQISPTHSSAQMACLIPKGSDRVGGWFNSWEENLTLSFSKEKKKTGKKMRINALCSQLLTNEKRHFTEAL